MSFELDDINVNAAPGEIFGTISRAEELLRDAGEDRFKRQDALNEIIGLLHRQQNIVRKAEEIKQVAKLFGYKTIQIERFVHNYGKSVAAPAADDADAPLPAWCSADRLYADGFVQLNEAEKGYKVGIYFNGKEQRLQRVSNFTVAPLLHIMDQRNNRRLIELYNGRKTVRVEIPSRALVTKTQFEGVVIEKGAFLCEGMSELQFKRMVGWLADEMPICYDLVSLGWQPDGKGFFAFANKVWHDGQLHEYNKLGVVEIGDTHYISMGVSNINEDFRKTDNPYENDLYLEHKASDVNFEQWAAQFQRVYGQNAPIGISFVFLSLFKDIVLQVTKCPHLYPYGPKGSGKSDYAESLLWLFFSGKNAQGNMIPGINLNFGQITPFAFYNALERFSNCPILLNEFDENRMEDWKFGAIKSAYDGEARVVGDSDSGKARKSKTQPVRGTMLIVGQYLSTGDDGSVLSRSLPLQFTLSRLDALTKEDMTNWEKLKKWEKSGLSGIICELLNHREYFKANFKTTYWECYEALKTKVEAMGSKAETRLLRNYSCALAAVKVMSDKLTFPFKYQAFLDKCAEAVFDHNSLLKENNSLSKFWKIVEFCFTRNMLNYNYAERQYSNTDFDIKTIKSIWLKRNATKEEVHFKDFKTVLYMRFNIVYPAFAKAWREQTGSSAPSEGTILKYLQDQPYYIGLCSAHNFHGTNTSAFVFDYGMLNRDGDLNLERGFYGGSPAVSENSQNDEKSTSHTAQQDTPF